MASNKQLEYNVQFLENTSMPEKILKLCLNVDEKTPKYLMHKSICIQDNNRRNRTASSKTRTEVTGGGRKPWKQKGTGRARSGSSTSPLWKGGGVAFGPKPRMYKKKINLKEKHLALTTALYNSRNKIQILNDLPDCLNKVSTKNFLNLIDNKTVHDRSKVLTLVVHKSNENLTLSTRNISSIILKYPNSITIKDILSSSSMFFTEKALLTIINNHTN
jgi:large subunit ribosomal protein L4